jgi:hypothetical protein
MTDGPLRVPRKAAKTPGLDTFNKIPVWTKVIYTGETERKKSLIVLKRISGAFSRASRIRSFFFILNLLFFIESSSSETVGPGADSTLAVKADVPPSGTMVYPVTPEMDFGFTRPRSFSFVTNFPLDYRTYFTTAFRKQNWFKIGLIAAGTAVLLAYDQPLVDNAQRLARRWGIPSDIRQKAIAHVGKFPVYVPASTGSLLYYIGDGTTHFLIAGSFMAYGFIARDNRALQTASQLAEGMLTVGTLVQVLKHATGHETPATATVSAGRWRPFPNQADYLRHVSKYDAYPSGHLATAMMCVTVISRNYPEHSYIRPLGYSLMAVLAFQMMNNGVHWASDYPLALALGYSFGKIIQSRGHTVIDRKTGRIVTGSTEIPKSWNVAPAILGRDGIGIALRCGW